MSEAHIDYGQRLEYAMRTRGVSTQQLAHYLGLSYQAVRQIVSGQSNAFSAGNHVRTCSYLGISSEWLALGEGHMQRDTISETALWPFGQVRPQDISRLSAQDKEEIEMLIRLKLRRLEH